MQTGPVAEHVEVAVVGAGLGGVAMAVNLRRAGVEDFVVVDRHDGPGGTWRVNTYPGAGCDVASHLYSYSFRRHDWLRICATQPEILEYIEQCVDEFGIRPHCRFGTAVTAMRWDADRDRWSLTTGSGSELTATVVVSAVGLFTTPRTLDVPGTDRFSGPVLHTARWDHRVDLRGRRVALVGNGTSGAQVATELADVAEMLTVYQREPSWVLPRNEHLLTDDERASRLGLVTGAYERARLFLVTDGMVKGLDPNGSWNLAMRDHCRRFLEESVDDPQLRVALTPTAPGMCKRTVFSDDYLALFNRADVELVPHEVTGLTSSGVVAADGTERDTDVVVLATGFHTTRHLSTVAVHGRGGQLLSDVWGDEPAAFLGMAVSGFPNLFLMYGPNTAPPSTSVVFVLERQAEYIARAVRRMRRRRLASIEVRPVVQRLYDRWLQSRMAGTAYTADCHSHYRLPSGRVVVSMPITARAYWALTRLLGSGPVLYRRVRTARARRRRAR